MESDRVSSRYRKSPYRAHLRGLGREIGGEFRKQLAVALILGQAVPIAPQPEVQCIAGGVFERHFDRGQIAARQLGLQQGEANRLSWRGEFHGGVLMVKLLSAKNRGLQAGTA